MRGRGRREGERSTDTAPSLTRDRLTSGEEERERTGRREAARCQYTLTEGKESTLTDPDTCFLRALTCSVRSNLPPGMGLREVEEALSAHLQAHTQDESVVMHAALEGDTAHTGVFVCMCVCLVSVLK